MLYKTILPLALLVGANAYAQDDNIANCEIVIEKPILEGDESGAKIATFMPAGDFVFSVFDADPGHLTEVDGEPIRALMCPRSSIVPTEFDAKLIKTGIPFFVSPNFDSPDSPFLTVQKSKDGYKHEYFGPDLSADDQAALKLFMEGVNGQ